MNKHDESYFLNRAEAHIALARKAEHEQVVKTHFHLAAAYLDRAHGGKASATAKPMRPYAH